MKKLLLAGLLSVIISVPFPAFAGDNGKTGFEIAGSVGYNEERFEKKVIFSTGEYEIILFAFTGKQGLKEHTVPFDAFLQVLEGEALLIMDGEEYHLKAGEGIKLHKDKAHTLKAKTSFKMILTKQKGKIM